MLRIITTALGILKVLVQAWRDRKIRDSAATAERMRIADAEQKAHGKMKVITRESPESIIDKLRKGGF